MGPRRHNPCSGLRPWLGPSLPCKVAEPKRKPLLEHPELLPEHPDNPEHAEHAELAETLEHPIDEARALHCFIL